MNLAEQTMGDEAAWAACSNQAATERVYEAERGALQRVANGLGDIEDAAFLAGRLGHPDLFIHVCAYCGRDASSADDPAVFNCCGEVGHTELVINEDD